jgi:hypothetical protein
MPTNSFYEPSGEFIFQMSLALFRGISEGNSRIVPLPEVQFREISKCQPIHFMNRAVNTFFKFLLPCFVQFPRGIPASFPFPGFNFGNFEMPTNSFYKPSSEFISQIPLGLFRGISEGNSRIAPLPGFNFGNFEMPTNSFYEPCCELNSQIPLALFRSISEGNSRIVPLPGD